MWHQVGAMACVKNWDGLVIPCDPATGKTHVEADSPSSCSSTSTETLNVFHTYESDPFQRFSVVVSLSLFCFLLCTGGNKDNRQDPAEPKQPSEGNSLPPPSHAGPEFISKSTRHSRLGVNCANRKQSMLGRSSHSSLPQTGWPCLVFLMDSCNTGAPFGHFIESLPRLQFSSKWS